MQEDVFLFLADHLRARLIETGFPLFASSFEVILHCEPAFHDWPLRPFSYWPEAAVCHVHIVNPMNPNYQCFSPLGLQLICILL